MLQLKSEIRNLKLDRRDAVQFEVSDFGFELQDSFNFKISSQGLFPFYRLGVNLDPFDVRPTALAMAAAGHQIRKPDFIDFAEVRRVYPVAGCDDTFGIQLPPAHFTDGDIALEPIDGGALELVADQHRSIRELHDGVHLVVTG